jgi:hypothetical protein
MSVKFILSRSKLLNQLWPLFVFFLIFGALLNNLGKIISLPNLFTLIRLLILILILFVTKKKALTNKVISFFYLTITMFIVFYLIISIFQGKLGHGLYFIRIYIEVFLVFYLAQYLKYYIDLNKFIRTILIIGALSSSVSIGSLFLFYTNSNLLSIMHASKEINFHWFLGVGKFIYRAGFPIGGPNQLGLFYSSLIILSLNFPRKSKKKNLGYLTFFFIGLLSTFSKSALLVLIIYILIINFRKFSNLIKLVPIIILVGFLFVKIDTTLLDGRFVDYTENLINNDDGSTEGHYESLVNAIDNFKEYSFVGYEKGTVGPRGKLFTDKYKNVESSFFIILYDMGLIVAFVYLNSLVALIKSSFFIKNQLFFLIAIFPMYFLLPIIHSIEITSFVFLVYVIIGLNKTFKFKHDFE